MVYRKLPTVQAATDGFFRLSCISGENREHRMTGCPVLANAVYTERHNSVARIVNKKLVLQFGLLKDLVRNYRYRPALNLENDRFKLY